MSERPATPTATIIGAWLTSGPAARVLALLNADGEEGRIVGGAVRNALLNLPVGEIDVATTALPEEVVRRARAARLGAELDMQVSAEGTEVKLSLPVPTCVEEKMPSAKEGSASLNA